MIKPRKISRDNKEAIAANISKLKRTIEPIQKMAAMQ